MLILSAAHQQAIQTHAQQTYPEECCGILLGRLERDEQSNRKIVLEVQPTQNAWSEIVVADLAVLEIAVSRHPNARRDRYWIDPQDLLKAQRQARDLGLQVIGIYHSHPDHPAIPSETDRLLAWTEYSYLILSVEQGQVTELLSWQLNNAHQFESEEIQTEAITQKTCHS